MQPTLDYRTIANLEQVSTSRLRELQWAVDWYRVQYAKASENSNRAWADYDKAIEDKCPRDCINDCFCLATLLDGVKSMAWYEWQNAKENLLALMN